MRILRRERKDYLLIFLQEVQTNSTLYLPQLCSDASQIPAASIHFSSQDRILFLFLFLMPIRCRFHVIIFRNLFPIRKVLHFRPSRRAIRS
jgi:hypothetical protein